MKIVKFNSQAEAQTEADRLITALDIPNGMIYGNPFQIEDGTWALSVKEDGSWPATNVIQGTIENYEPEGTS